MGRQYVLCSNSILCVCIYIYKEEKSKGEAAKESKEATKRCVCVSSSKMEIAGAVCLLKQGRSESMCHIPLQARSQPIRARSGCPASALSANGLAGCLSLLLSSALSHVNRRLSRHQQSLSSIAILRRDSYVWTSVGPLTTVAISLY